jgi:ABC-type Fe3+/spermidine/putrescine transport system ATPase subunit
MIAPWRKSSVSLIVSGGSTGNPRGFESMLKTLTQAQSVEDASPALLQLHDVSKLYGSVHAVDGLFIDVRKGEVLTLLGPSGCGKSTTMRLIMGLERCDAGEIFFQGRLVDSAARGEYVPVHKREMGMVFQSYAIWPHMTVFDNVAYPLRVRRLKASKVRDAVERALDLVGLTGFENRPSPNLSGGQQQRVALARSLVFEPQILLLDEPFSNLDARLREQMRAEVRILQRRLGITVVFVTHDQVEALSLSDRIVVMKSGRVEQIGTPRELYERPGTPAVRDFLGRTVMLEGNVAESTGGGRVLVDLVAGPRLLAAAADDGAALSHGSSCTVAIRPEKVEIRPASSGGGANWANVLFGKIAVLLFVGDRYEARIALSSGETILLYLTSSPQWHEGQDVLLHLPADDMQVWPA